MISKQIRGSATKIVLTAIVYWCVWIYLISHGPMKKFQHDLYSADARLSLAFMVLGTLILSIWTWRKYRQVSGLLSGQIHIDDSGSERSWAGAKWLGVLAWLLLGIFIMVFPALFLGSAQMNFIFVGGGLFAWLIALWVVITGDGKPRDIDLDS